MATNTTVVEVVQFQASGLDEITARTKVYAAELDNAEKRSKALMGLMNDPRYGRHAQMIATITQRTEQHTLSIRNQQYATQASTAAFGRHTQIVTNLNRQYDVMKGKAQNAAAAADIRSGSAAKHAVEMAAVNREYEALSKHANLQELVAVHGRLGGVVRANESSINQFKQAGAVAYLGLTGAAMGFMRAGLQGTVEGMQLERSFTRLSRQVAGIAIPAVEMLARTVGRVASIFERLSGTQQDVLLGLGMFAVVGAPVVAMFGTILKLATATKVVLEAWKASSMMPGIPGGRPGIPPVAMLPAAGGGAAVAGAAASGGGVAAAKAAEEAAAKRAAAETATAGGRGLGARAARALPFIGNALSVGFEAFDMKAKYDKRRAEGGSMFGSMARGYGESVANAMTFGSVSAWHGLNSAAKFLSPGAEDKKPDDHRDPTPGQSSLLELGQSHQLIQEEVLKATSKPEEAKTNDILTEFKTMVEGFLGKFGMAPPPASTE